MDKVNNLIDIRCHFCGISLYALCLALSHQTCINDIGVNLSPIAQFASTAQTELSTPPESAIMVFP